MASTNTALNNVLHRIGDDTRDARAATTNDVLNAILRRAEGNRGNARDVMLRMMKAEARRVTESETFAPADCKRLQPSQLKKNASIRDSLSAEHAVHSHKLEASRTAQTCLYSFMSLQNPSLWPGLHACRQHSAR